MAAISYSLGARAIEQEWMLLWQTYSREVGLCFQGMEALGLSILAPRKSVPLYWRNSSD